MKRYILIALCLTMFLTGCSHLQASDYAEKTAQSVTPTDEVSLSENSFDPEISPASDISQATNDTNQSDLQATQTPIPDSSAEWNPNHWNVNITRNEVNDYGAVEEYVFISSTEGWKAYIEPIGAGQRCIVLYKTTDGGKHWNEIADGNDPSTTITGGDILFINSNVGWIINYFPMNGVFRLYKTSDGGITWKPQDVSTSSEYSDVNFMAGLPVFFSENDGIIFASCFDVVINDDIDSVAFITHDGGETWSLKSKDENDVIFTWSINSQDGSSSESSSTSEFEVIYNNEIWNSIDGIQWQN